MLVSSFCGTLTTMKSSQDVRAGVQSPIGAERRIPTWAQGLVAGLARDLPAVLTRDDIAERIGNQHARSADDAIRELRRLGWLVRLGVQGAWTFIPPGQDRVVDPYLDVRAWRRMGGDDVHLAGVEAAWFLGYLDRAPVGPVQVWVPDTTTVPPGLRSRVSTVGLRWPKDPGSLAPSSRLLIRRKLDLTRWSSGLPAFGPEALAVQLSVRPSSFGSWEDLVAHLPKFVEDCDDERLARLLVGQSVAAWQRAAYLLHSGGSPSRGIALIATLGDRRLPVTTFPANDRSLSEAPSQTLWVPQYNLVDHLLAPLQGIVGKA